MVCDVLMEENMFGIDKNKIREFLTKNEIGGIISNPKISSLIGDGMKTFKSEIEEKISNIVKESLKSNEKEKFSINDNFSVPLKKARENFEKEYLTSQLKKFGGNISKTAKFVGMERAALHRKLKILGVKDLN